MDIWNLLMILITFDQIEIYIIEDVLDMFSKSEQEIIKHYRDMYWDMPKECRKGNNCFMSKSSYKTDGI